MSYLFWSLVSFWKASWYCLVCCVQAISTTTRGLFCTYCRYTVNIFTVRYQYCSYFYYGKICLRRYISWYFQLTYNDFVIFIMYYFKLSRNYAFITNIVSVHMWYLREQIFLQQTKKPITFNFWSSTKIAETNFLLSKQSTTERRNTIGGLVIVVL